MDEVLMTRQGKVVTLSLNRPERLNALSWPLIREIHAALSAIVSSDARVVIIRGEGSSFCAGADLKEMAHELADFQSGDTAQEFREIQVQLQDISRLMLSSPKTFIGRIHGWCVGGGFEMALACDLRVCADSARFYFAEAMAGLTITGGATYLLPLTVGVGRAKRLVLCAAPIDAGEALTMSLVDWVVPESELDRKVDEVVAGLLRTSPLAAGAHKRMLQLGPQIGLEAALNLEHEAILAIAGSADAREGSEAFSEKREPRFTGK